MIRPFIAAEARSSLPSIEESNPGENEPQDGRKAKGKPTWKRFSNDDVD